MQPFLVQEDASGNSLTPLGGREGTYDEAWLQEMLRQQPGILPVAEIEPIFSPLVPIGVEVVTERGAIDNLFISHRGYIVLVETKLWRNPEARREVVAQAIDYASSVSKWDYGELDRVARKYTRDYEGTETSLVDWVETSWGPVERGQVYFEETVSKNLRLGRFLTLIVGDRIRRSLTEMLSYANEYPHLATNVALAELRCYRWGAEDDWPLLVIPRIVARTEIVERSIIQVTVEPAIDYRLEVHQERIGEERKRGTRAPITEEAFWEILKEQAPREYREARQLISAFRDRPGITVDSGEGSVLVRLDIQDTGEQATPFFVNRMGRILVWPNTIKGQLEKAGVPTEVVQLYDRELRRIMQMGEDRKAFGREVSDVDLGDFKGAVDAFIERVQTADLIER